MRWNRVVAVAAASVTLIALAGCSAAGSPSPVGTWGKASAQGEPYLELARDGSLSGTDGCNRLTGKWTQSGSKLTFGPLASTMMFCQGVDTWLVKASTATLSGSTMTVLDKDHAKIGTLTKSE